MPLTPPGIAATLAPALSAAGVLGTSVPQYALGIGVGVCQWAQQVVVLSIDTGTLGVGASTGPLLVPTPSLLQNLLASFAAMGLAGTMAAPLATGIANGLTLAFAQALVLVSHPSVGVGASVNTFQAGTAAPFMLAGFASVGFHGTYMSNIATAIGLALDTTFRALVLPLLIVGSVSPMASTGAGIGKIV